MRLMTPPTASRELGRKEKKYHRGTLPWKSQSHGASVTIGWGIRRPCLLAIAPGASRRE